MDSGRLSLFEVESFVRGLQPMGLADVGSDRWSTQHDQLEKLNLQAHLDAQAGKHDEYVVEQVTAQDRVGVLVHELLVIEAWKERVFPLLLDHFSPVTAVKAYMVLYHEATLCNLLEVLLYHASVCEAGGDAMMELGDYCVRNVNLLNTGAFKKLQEDKPDDHKAVLNRSTQDSLRQQSLDIGFSVAVCAVSMLRFLSDHVNVLPLGVTSRLLHTHDVLLSLVPLVESPPWSRRRGGGNKLEKFSDQRWLPVAPQDALLLTKLEGQVWLTIYNLMMDRACRKQYQYNTHRKGVLVRLKRFFTDILMDQLPLLRELKRLIEELAILDPPPPTASSLAIIEQVPEMREEIVSNAQWGALAEAARKGCFANDEAARQRDIARLASTYNLSHFEEALAPPSCAECGTSNPGAMKRCARCKTEWYCGRECQVKAWKKHQKICDAVAKMNPNPAPAAAAKATGAGAGAGAGASATAAAAKPASSAAASSSATAKPASSSSSSSSSSAAAASVAKPSVAASAPSAAAPAPAASSSAAASKPATAAASPSPAASKPVSAAAPAVQHVSTATAGLKKPLIEMLDSESDDDEDQAAAAAGDDKAKVQPKASTNPLDSMD